jgi:hypothetical protein
MPLASAVDVLGMPTLTLPDGRTQTARLRAGAYEMLETLQPGLYAFHGHQGSSADEMQDVFSVKRPAAESQLDRLTPENLADLLQPAPTDPDLANAPRLRGKWPLAFRFAVLAALFFLAEAVLAYIIARKRAQRTQRLDLNPIY